MPTPPARSLFDRPRWTADDAREVVAALHRSGQSVSVFAAAHGLDPQRVYLWRRRLGASAELSTFRELVVQPARTQHESVEGSAAFELVLTAGQVLRVPVSFEAAALARLLEVLARVGMC
jgi:transposase-like protein